MTTILAVSSAIASVIRTGIFRAAASTTGNMVDRTSRCPRRYRWCDGRDVGHAGIIFPVAPAGTSWRRYAFFALALLANIPAEAVGKGRCGAIEQRVDADGRLMNHLPYPEIASRNLVRMPATFGPTCRVNQAMLPDLTALMTKARADGMHALHLISCHRSVERQTTLFCDKRPRGMTPAERAFQVAPPGFSEHSTGYSIDFGDRSSPKCNLQQCFSQTPGSRWLEANAALYGYEMSFPPGNRQGVSSEPWHWRWIGRGDGDPAAHIFSEARARFPDPATEEHVGEAPASSIFAAYVPADTTRVAVDPATIADDDFARNRDPALWLRLTVERISFRDGRASWSFWRVVNQDKAEGPLWIVPHDNENAAFDAAVRAVGRHGGIAVIIDTGARDHTYRARLNSVTSGPALDPNRIFTSSGSRYVANVLADLAIKPRLIVALHTNAPGFDPGLSRCGGTAVGRGGISIRVCNAHFQPVASRTAVWPFDDDDSLAILPIRGGAARDAAFCGPALVAADYNLVFENVAGPDGSLSHYAVLHGLRYINLETRDRGSREADLADARNRLASMIDGVMTKCLAGTQNMAAINP